MRIIVHGGYPLRGTARPSGNSNAALALIAASMLTDQPVTLHNVPDTLSTSAMIAAAERLGATVQRNGTDLHLVTPTLLTRSLERDLADQVGTVLLLAPILARRRHARMEVLYPLSRLHTHLTALRDLGVTVRASSGVIELEAAPWEQRTLTLLQTSVTATALAAMLAATLGQQTTILNAASEPHVQDMLRFLQVMGAHVEGIGSNVLRIRGIAEPGGGSLTIAPDHIEAASPGSDRRDHPWRADHCGRRPRTPARHCACLRTAGGTPLSEWRFPDPAGPRHVDRVRERRRTGCAHRNRRPGLASLPT